MFMTQDLQLLKDVLSVPTKTYKEDLMVDFLKKWLTEKINIFGLYKHEYYNKQEDFQFKVGLGVKL